MRFNPAAAAVCCLLAQARPLWADLRVVTTTPDLASIASAIAGDKAKIEAIAKAFQDPHHVEAKPSLIVKLMKADIFIQTGLELESAWATLLIRGSGNKRIQPGSPGFIDASDAIEPIEKPDNPSRALGDIHPGGNPHYMTDPSNALLAARLIEKALEEAAPADSKLFQSNLAAFEAQLNANIARWEKELAPYRGVKYASYHKDFAYFAKRFGFVSVGEIEPKPGIPPTAQHTTKLIEKMKSEKVPLILTPPWYEKRTTESIAQATGAAVITTALSPGSVPGTIDYISTVEYNVRMIVSTLKGKK